MVVSPRWFDDLGLDVRYAWRSLAASRVFTTVAVLALALGIGATTAIFSVVHGVLLKPLPYVDADRVVSVRVNAPAASTAASSAPAASGPSVSASLGAVTVTELIELRSRIKGLSHMAFRGGPSFVTVSGVGEARRLQGVHIAPGVFDVLGVKPLLGRTFGATEEAPGAEHVMLLAHDTWQRQFNGNPAVVADRVRAFAEDLTLRLRATPGLRAAAYAQQLPLVGLTRERVLSTQARAPGAVRARQSRSAPREPRLSFRHGHAHCPGAGPDRG